MERCMLSVRSRCASAVLSRARLLLSAVGTGLALCAGSSSSLAQTLEVVAASDHPAPALNGRTTGRTLLRHVSSAGGIAFSALTTTTPPGGPVQEALYAYDPGQYTLHLRAGDQAPGQPQGVSHAAVYEAFLSAAGRFSVRTQLAGTGVVSTNNEMLIHGPLNQAISLVREGDAIGPLTYISNTPPTFFDESANAVFAATLVGPGVTTTNDRAILLARPGSRDILLREGDAGTFYGVNGPPPTIGSTMFARVANNSFAFWSQAASASTQAIVRRVLGSPNIEGIIYTGAQLQQLGGDTVVSIDQSRWDMSSDASLAFTINTTGPANGSRTSLWTVTPAGGASMVLRTGQPAPQLPNYTISEVAAVNYPPSVRGGGGDAFIVIASVLPATNGFRRALYGFTASDPTPRLLAATGHALTNRPTAILSDFISAQFHGDAQGNAMFAARVVENGVTSTAILTAHPTTGLRLIARTGEPLPPLNRTVVTLSAYAGIDSPLLGPRLVSDRGRFAFSANFTDGSTAILAGRIPGTCNDVDFNNDTITPDSQDLDDFLSVLSAGQTACPTCDSIDFNNDGLAPDTQDLDAFLRVLAGGPCTG